MFLKYLARAIFVLAIIGAIYLLVRTLRQYSLDDILSTLGSIPLSNLAIGLGFAACSYFCLAVGDWLATRYAGKPLKFRQTALASFVSLSIGHNVGVAALSSGAVRYRFYSRWGLDGEAVAKIILFCGVTVALGLSTLGSIGMALRPEDAGDMMKLDTSTIRMLSGAFAIFPVVYLLLCAVLRKPLRIRSWSMKLPPMRLALAQVVVGTVNFSFVSAALHQMLTAFAPASYLKVAAASITANIAAIISHVPGGLGVLEATIVHILPGASSIAAVIAFRVVYYFIPLAFGLILLATSELTLKKKTAGYQPAAAE